MHQHTVLSTKKLKPSVTAVAAACGILVRAENFIQTSIVFSDNNINAVKNAGTSLVFTSANAVKAYNKISNKAVLLNPVKKIYCLLGETLSAAAALKNIEHIFAAKHSAALAHLITQHKTAETISFICGNRRRNELPQLLSEHNITVDEIIVYNTHSNGKAVNNKFDAVLFFSPSAVEAFFQTNILSAKVPCFCIGQTTAASVKEHTANLVISAAETSQQSVMEAVIAYFKQYNKKKNDKRSRKRTVAAKNSQLEK